MAVKTFAAIYIGSYEVSLKIFEISAKKRLRGIDHIRARVDLGREAYRKKVIGYELVEELCDTLLEFSKIMSGYKVDSYEVYASAVLRDIENEWFVLDQIHLRTGFSVQVLSNSEHRFLSYRSVAGRKEFGDLIKSSAAVVDVGGAGLQITLFSDGKLINTHHIMLGTVLLKDRLANRSNTLTSYELQMEEYINKKIASFCRMCLDGPVENVVFMGDYGMDLVRHAEKNHKEEERIKSDKLLKYIHKLQKKTLEEIAEELGLSNAQDPLVLPAVFLFRGLLEKMNAQYVWVPGVNINDGIAYDYAERMHLIKPEHDFEGDVVSAAKNLAIHYESDMPHVEALAELSVQIFDTIKKIHGLGRRERLLLQAAALLHDCGKYISIANSPESAYHIIMSSEIIGLSHLERRIVASTVLLNSLDPELYGETADELDRENYLIAAKLAAILRVANALDQSHKQKFENLKIAFKDRTLVITVETFESISLEQALFAGKTTFFEHVFSIKPILKEKRVQRI